MAGGRSEISVGRVAVAFGLGGAAAIALAGVGAMVLGAGFGVSGGAHSGEAVRPVAAAALVAVFAAVTPSIVAAIAFRRGRAPVALGLLLGSGAVAVGAVVFDCQLITDPLDANRFELARPLTAAELAAGPGAYLLLLGHVALLLSGSVAAVALGAREPDPDEESDVPLARRLGSLWVICTVFAAVALAVAVFPDPWRVSDHVIVSVPALDGPWFGLAGAVVLAVVVLAGVAAVLTSTAHDAAGAALVGVGIGALAIVGPRLAAGVADDGVDASAATIVATLGAVVLAVAGGLVFARIRITLPTWRGVTRIPVVAPNVVAGCAGLAGAVLLGVGALAPQLTVPPDVAEPTIYATRTALVAAVVLAVVAVWLLLSEFADAARPALGVVAVAALVPCAAVLNAVVEAQPFVGVGVGVGSYAIGAAAVAIVVSGIAAAVGGAHERDALDRSEGRDVDRRLAGLGGGAALVGVVALGLPLYRGADASATSFAFPWGWDTWGQIGFACALVVVAVVGPRSRPQRGAALYGGAAAGLAVYLASWPLTAGRVADPTVGPGVPAAALSIVLFVTAGVVAGRSRG